MNLAAPVKNLGVAVNRRSLTMRLMSGVLGCEHVFGPEVGILNICCRLMFCSAGSCFFHFGVSFACRKLVLMMTSLRDVSWTLFTSFRMLRLIRHCTDTL